MKHKQLVANLEMFEAQRIIWADGLVNPGVIKESPRELALKIESKKALS